MAIVSAASESTVALMRAMPFDTRFTVGALNLLNGPVQFRSALQVWSQSFRRKSRHSLDVDLLWWTPCLGNETSECILFAGHVLTLGFLR